MLTYFSIFFLWLLMSRCFFPEGGVVIIFIPFEVFFSLMLIGILPRWTSVLLYSTKAVDFVSK